MEKKADIVVGIDFGMTCSGVAWSMGPEWPDPRTIQRWPGRLGHEIRSKVPTSISYDVHTGQRTTWGFFCTPEDERYECNTLFKLLLDPNYKDPTLDPPPFEQVHRWYLDYLRCLYDCIIKTFASTIPRLPAKRIDFVFSVPVTWRNDLALLARIEETIQAAGFGNRGNDTSSIYMTEAEAAAVHASKQSMTKGEVFLVVDAGGGTTDVHILKVASAARGHSELLPLAWTEGAAIGSTLIDYKVRALIKTRLALIGGGTAINIDDCATQMMLEKFETFKCSFGSPGMDTDKLQLPVPGMQAGLNIPHANIVNSSMIITKGDLKVIFDHQVDKMCALITQQLRLVRERNPREVINYLVLSGGLGSSPYVQERIKAKYEKAAVSGAERLEVLVASEPQLAVVHGMVAARIQSLRGNGDILAHRCCPASFGILCRELYNPSKHQGDTIVQDPYDKRRWAERQINWIIRQGQVVRTDTGASHHYRFKIPAGRELEPFKTYIVMSELPASELPTSMRHGSAREVCAVSTVLSAKDMRRKNANWYNLKKQYNLVEFEVRMIVDTGLRFEIWTPDGMRSQSHDEIDIQWERVGGQATTAVELDGSDFH